MGEWFKQLPKKLAEFWNKYTARQKVLFFSVAAAVLITLVALFFLLNRTTYVTLSVFEDTGATAEAATLLEENGIDIKVSNDALKIDVAEEQVSQARLLLGQNGITTTTSDIDLTWLYDNSFNTTDSEKKLKAKMYLENCMETDLKAMDGIAKASVTIDLPASTSSIYTDEQEPSVSIMITTDANFGQEAALTIAEYAKSCVGASGTDNITIIDNKGNLLFSGTSTQTSLTTTLSVEQQVEEYYNSKIWNLMVNSGVYDEVSVASNLSINISPEEILNIEYYSNDEDDTGPKANYYYYLAENVDGTGGVVGTDANGEEITDYNLLDYADGESTLNIIKEEYNTSSTTTKKVNPVGEVDMANSSMALYLTKYKIYDEAQMEKDGLLEDQTFAEFKAANSEVIENSNMPDMVSMLSQATGIKADKIYVVERIVPVFYPIEESQVPVKSIVTIGLALLIAGLLLFVVFKSMKPDEVVEVEPELSVEALLATTKENQTLDDIEFSEKSAAKEQIDKFVDENPEAVAALLKNWLTDEWE
ncbi:MAG: hypothetical protein E7257_02350 [Lachnospiraceae bacterium]|nr:hypothetical protein [Lachnospiraceae bacterium]